MFLQSYIVPVCLFARVDGQAELRSLQGTAFFVGTGGVFFTARHVIERAFAIAGNTDLEVGLAIKGDHGKSSEERLAPLQVYEFAPAPYDVAAGIVDYRPESPLRFERREVALWQEIATLGYPKSAETIEDKALWLNLRAHKGYVQRVTLPRDRPIGNHPAGFELSFTIAPGLSGAPIFTVPNEGVIGIGVGSYRTEEIDDSMVEIFEDGREYRELRMRIEQYGFAQDLAGLLNWRPTILRGPSLEELR